MRRRAGKRSYKPRSRAMITFKYRQQYGVIVICRDERHQRDIYDRLAKRGLRCRVVTV